MAVWYQEHYAVPTATRAEKRGQFEFMRVIYNPFSHLIGDAPHGFVDIRQVGCPQRSKS
jgi:hypothetical protein